MVLCDTNIFIHAFNGNPDTIGELQKIGLDNIVISCRDGHGIVSRYGQ